MEEAGKLHQQLKENPRKLSGQDMPVVDEYIYLGLALPHNLPLDLMAKWRLGKLRRPIERYSQSFLAAQYIPTSMRVTIFRGVVGATVLYGSGIYVGYESEDM